jgi:hypothetical protein
MSAIEFMVEPLSKTAVQVRWSRRLDAGWQSVVRDILDEIETVDGVERVELRRYSIRIEVADFVSSAIDVVAEIVEILRHGDYRSYPAYRLHNPEIVVKWSSQIVVKVP